MKVAIVGAELEENLGIRYMASSSGEQRAHCSDRSLQLGM